MNGKIRRIFSEKIKQTLKACHNCAMATREVIEDLITPAREMDAATKRGVDLDLTDDDGAFHDAPARYDSAARAMGDTGLKVIATGLISRIRTCAIIVRMPCGGARVQDRVPREWLARGVRGRRGRHPVQLPV